MTPKTPADLQEAIAFFDEFVHADSLEGRDQPFYINAVDAKHLVALIEAARHAAPAGEAVNCRCVHWPEATPAPAESELREALNRKLTPDEIRDMKDDVYFLRLSDFEIIEKAARTTLERQAAGEGVEEYKPGTWFHANTIDEMEAFYKSRLPAIRAAAKDCGYAIAVHGSMRRDFDLIAMPWQSGAESRDVLAKAIQNAACGMATKTYEWEQKPAGRYATAFPVCWCEWQGMTSAGHIDLSVIEARTQGAAVDVGAIKKQVSEHIHKNRKSNDVEELGRVAEAQTIAEMTIDLLAAQGHLPASLKKSTVSSSCDFAPRSDAAPIINKAGGDAVDPAPSSEKGELEAILESVPDLVAETMQEQWDDIVGDTGCCPTDISMEGKLIVFSADHWAQFTGDRVKVLIKQLIEKEK